MILQSNQFFSRTTTLGRDACNVRSSAIWLQRWKERLS